MGSGGRSRDAWRGWQLMRLENLILVPLHQTRQPRWLRYALTLSTVGVAFWLRLLLDVQLKNYPFLLFISAVFLSAMLFDKGSGYLATFASAALATYALIEPNGRFTIEPSLTLPLILYVVIGCGISAMTEALRHAVEELETARSQQALFLDELGHRTKNDLMMIASLLTLQARGQHEPSAKLALEAAVARVNAIAKAHERLRDITKSNAVELASYVEDLCAGLGNLLRDIRPIAVRVSAERMTASSAQAVFIGLIVNELVTNAFKHAFPGEQGGTVAVNLRNYSDRMEIMVGDNGVGCPTEVTRGMGSRLVRLLAAQLGGHVERSDTGTGCCVTVTLRGLDAAKI